MKLIKKWFERLMADFTDRRTHDNAEFCESRLSCWTNPDIPMLTII